MSDQQTAPGCHFIPYGNYIAPCGYIADKRHPAKEAQKRLATTCPDCQAHMTDLGDLPEPAA